MTLSSSVFFTNLSKWLYCYLWASFYIFQYHFWWLECKYLKRAVVNFLYCKNFTRTSQFIMVKEDLLRRKVFVTDLLIPKSTINISEWCHQRFSIVSIVRSSRPKMLCRSAVAKFFPKLTERHLYQSITLLKLQT